MEYRASSLRLLAMAALASNRDDGTLGPLGDHQLAEDSHETSNHHAAEIGMLTTFLLLSSSLSFPHFETPFFYCPASPFVNFISIFGSFLFSFLFLSFSLSLHLSLSSLLIHLPLLPSFVHHEWQY